MGPGRRVARDAGGADSRLRRDPLEPRRGGSQHNKLNFLQMEASKRPLALADLLEVCGRALGVGFDETSPYEESFEAVFRDGRLARLRVAMRMKLTLGQFDIPLPRDVLFPR